MLRRLAFGLLVAAAVAVFATPTVRAQPSAILCEFGSPGDDKSVVEVYLVEEGENLRDAVQRCLDDNGRPAGVDTKKKEK